MRAYLTIISACALGQHQHTYNLVLAWYLECLEDSTTAFALAESQPISLSFGIRQAGQTCGSMETVNSITRPRLHFHEETQRCDSSLTCYLVKLCTM